ncbi:MAG: hypothetical protein ACI3Z8_04610 [Paludibacteraceae bacterium]
MKKLHLVLKKQWYDMIASGKKKEEYRDIKPYWIMRLVENPHDDSDIIVFKDFSNVIFHLGYTLQTIEFEIESISVGMGKPEWGAKENTHYFIIKLGVKIA